MQQQKLVMIALLWQARFRLSCEFRKERGLAWQVNIYAPCDMTAKQALWDRLSMFLQNYSDDNVCLCGDFNLVRSMKERKGRGTLFRQHDSDNFNKFIDDNFLLDLSICGICFTWYRGDGSSMGRLDRFLLSGNWCSECGKCVQVALQRGLSDHVMLVLTVDDKNWGPRPLRMLKCWADFPGYGYFFRDNWGSFNIDG